MKAVDDKKHLPAGDIWAHFADFLAELIARHAEELDIDSWPDPHKIIHLQEMQDMYRRFMQLKKSRKNMSDTDIPLEIPMDIWYSPYIQISGFEEKAS